MYWISSRFLLHSCSQTINSPSVHFITDKKTCLASSDWSSQMVAPAVAQQHYHSLRPNLSTMPNSALIPAIHQLLLKAQFVQHVELHHDPSPTTTKTPWGPVCAPCWNPLAFGTSTRAAFAHYYIGSDTLYGQNIWPNPFIIELYTSVLIRPLIPKEGKS